MPPIDPVIIAANPYTPNLAWSTMQFDNPIVVAQQVHLGTWVFKGVPYYIEKALKVPYQYKDFHNVQIEEYLLIGFAGGGAY
jgi:hypothetical protein